MLLAWELSPAWVRSKHVMRLGICQSSDVVGVDHSHKGVLNASLAFVPQLEEYLFGTFTCRVDLAKMPSSSGAQAMISKLRKSELMRTLVWTYEPLGRSRMNASAMRS